MRNRYAAAALIAAAALATAACGSSSPSSSTPAGTASGQAASGAALKSATIKGASVLTNAGGFTLYWFAPDTATKSNCNGGCAQIWPPVKGPVTVATGTNGTVGTITRSDGTVQATYDGHPLYTYTADTSPGQANGNGINASGGVWHEVTVSGAPAPASSSSSGRGGYSY
jgi:predicted lipoprotein with Yx(FWY)xxD motif